MALNYIIMKVVQNMQNDFKYKDCSPLQTINRIRGILGELNILTVENLTMAVEGYYTVKVEIAGTGLFSVGKGVNQVYALASGYGELIERIQNNALYRFKIAMCQEAYNHGDFVYAPDEKQVSINDLLDSREKCINTFTSEAKDNEEKHNILKEWNSIEINSSNKPDSFVAVPYLRLNDGKIINIPYNMISLRFGSNGMCAGNTNEEALVQGISEVIERHATTEIITKNIVPPTIPDSYLKKYPHLYSMIKRLENYGNFQLIIKDCSLGEGYPVTGAILLDKNTSRYFVRFGCHPVFEIALERTLTEILQGKDLNNTVAWMKSFSYLIDLCDNWSNSLQILIDGFGFSRPEFFSDNFSYEFVEFRKFNDASNKEMLQYLIGLLKEKGHEIFIRDVSFLGFPSFHVLVPFFSEIYDLNTRIIDIMKNNNDLMRISRNLNGATYEELKLVIGSVYMRKFTHQDSIIKFLRLPVKTTFPYNLMKRDKLVCSAFYKTGDYENAYKAIDGYLQEIDSGKIDPAVSYFKCVRDYIGARNAGVDNESYIKGILGKFYTEDIVEKVMAGMRNPEETFKAFGALSCYRCDECSLRNHCWYPSIKDYHMIIKDSYALNVINQERNTYLSISW